MKYTINVHGIGGYAHGCRCRTCGAARLHKQRERRKTKKPRKSKYDELPASSPSVLKAFRDKIQGKG